MRTALNVLLSGLALGALTMVVGCNSEKPTGPVVTTPPKDGIPTSAQVTTPELPKAPTGASNR